MEKQLFGPGQGLTLGPFLWLILFTLIVTSIDPHLRRISLQSTDSKITVEDVGEAFVDDRFLGCTSTYEHDPLLSEQENKRMAELNSISGLHDLAQQWERLLFSIGGAICLQKSFWYLISWTWSKSGTAKLSTIAKSPGTLELTSGYNLTHKVVVPSIESTDAYRTLGVRVSPSGDNNLAYSTLRDQSKDFAVRLASSRLTREAAYWAYWQYYNQNQGFLLQP